jgi:hypothetical protein
MNYFKAIYRLSFYFITLITFVFGGLLQYFIGISNTIITFLIVVLMYVVYILYVLLKGRIVLNRVVFFSITYLILIIVSAIINKRDLISTLIYFIFPLLPLGVFFFCYINYKESIISQNKIFKLFYYISLIQLPILLLQINFYGFFISFNNSGQKIDWYDFMFGSFFIKSDHSLALFLLFIIASIIFSMSKRVELVKYPILSIIYLSVTVFLTESNISKVFLVILLLIAIIVPLYIKYKNSYKFKVSAAILFLIIISIGYGIRDQKFVQNRLGGAFERQYSMRISEKQYKLGTAKRGQILIMVVNKLKTKWIGDGPYSYFNILTGKFTKTKHFTQLIWTYFDLGILGVLVIFGFLLSILRYLDIAKGMPFVIFLGIMMVYAFYTTIFSDIAIMSSLMLIFNKKNK